jgi:hypothetical protein
MKRPQGAQLLQVNDLLRHVSPGLMQQVNDLLRHVSPGLLQQINDLLWFFGDRVRLP